MVEGGDDINPLTQYTELRRVIGKMNKDELILYLEKVLKNIEENLRQDTDNFLSKLACARCKVALDKINETKTKKNIQ